MDEISDEYENWPDRTIISYVLLIAENSLRETSYFLRKINFNINTNWKHTTSKENIFCSSQGFIIATQSFEW